MKTKKLSLERIQGKLSKNEMKKIMAGSTLSCSTSGGCVANESRCCYVDYYCCVSALGFCCG